MRRNGDFFLGLGLLLGFATLAQGCGDSHSTKKDTAFDAVEDARATGGVQGSGGVSGSVGTIGTGGVQGSGGLSVTGGVQGSGGSSGTGGVIGAGGVTGTGLGLEDGGGVRPDTGIDGPKMGLDVAIDRRGVDESDARTALDSAVDQALEPNDTGPTCGLEGQSCCAGDTCYGDEKVCSTNQLCVPCGRTGQTCCRELLRTMRAGEQRGLCKSNHDACGTDGLCAACGAEGEACCANGRCDNNGCCSGGVCVTDGTSCGVGDGVCASGACADCGREGQSCCNGSCGPNLGCNAAGTCACGGKGEPCCGAAKCDDPGLGCFRYTCQTGNSECPATAPRQEEPCNYLGTAVCSYPSAPPWVYDCMCQPYGWSCIQ